MADARATPPASEPAPPAGAGAPPVPALPSLPHTWRPRRARYATLGIALAVVVAVGGLALLLPAAGGGREMRWSDRIAVFSVGLGIAWFLVRHASVKVTATAEGLIVANLFRRRRVAYGEVLAVTLRKGDPWVTLDLSDGETLAVMGIQSNDGPAAPRAARQIARLVAAHTAAQPPAPAQPPGAAPPPAAPPA